MTSSRRRQAGITLVELLVGMTIATLISGMLIGTWIALSDSYSFTTKDTKAREYARDAARRLSREIRDAQPVPGNAAIRTARPYRIYFTTLFNDSEAANAANTSPVLVGYLERYNAAQGTWDLYRLEDSDGSAGLSYYTDRKMLVASNLVRPTDGTAPLFEYSMYNSSGQLAAWDGVSTSTIVSVKIRMLVDLNPGHSPNRTEVITTVEPRNARQY